MTRVLFLLLFSAPSACFSGFQLCRMESSSNQWPRDQVVDDNDSWVGEDGIGEEETNATVLVGDALCPLPDPALGVLSGDRRQDFVGEAKSCTWADASRTVSVHFKVRLSIILFSFSFSFTSSELSKEDGESWLQKEDWVGVVRGWWLIGGSEFVLLDEEFPSGLGPGLIEDAGSVVGGWKRLLLLPGRPKMPYDACLTGDEAKLESRSLGSRTTGLKPSFWGIGVKGSFVSLLISPLSFWALKALSELDPLRRDLVFWTLFVRTGRGTLLGEGASRASRLLRSRRRGLKFDFWGMTNVERSTSSFIASWFLVDGALSRRPGEDRWDSSSL